MSNIRVNSPEFAKMWRIMSECLLEMVQGLAATMYSDVSSPRPQTEAPSATDTDTYASPAAAQRMETSTTPAREGVETRYAINPLPDGNGNFLFKGLRDEKSPEAIFRIVRFSDDTYEFSLCEDISLDARQNLKTNPNWLSKMVAQVEGEITSDCRIINIAPGKGEKSGRSVKITAPLKAQFK